MSAPQADLHTRMEEKKSAFGEGAVHENPYAARMREAEKTAERTGKSSSAFRTISEVADDLGVQQHVLRFWETKFSQIRPLKRGGGRRYYRPEDVALLKSVHHLLYTEGYTIKGVQKLLRDVGKKKLVENFGVSPLKEEIDLGETSFVEAEDIKSMPVQIAVNQDIKAGMSSTQRQILGALLAELKELRAIVKKAS